MTIHSKIKDAALEEFLFNLQKDILTFLPNQVMGIYIHGSIAMGGFNPLKSDVDLLVVTKKPTGKEFKRQLAELFLAQSNQPYPIEISFLNIDQLKNWQHPCPFDFHYSEYWRERYEQDLLKGTEQYLNSQVQYDPDLAAHMTILNNRGITLYGQPISQVFPVVPSSDYLAAIKDDVQGCFENIEQDPVYCILNMLRVYWYISERVISSKLEAGERGLSLFNDGKRGTVKKALASYTNEENVYFFEKEELILFSKCMSTLLVEMDKL